jgi:hypothetical protein
MKQGYKMELNAENTSKFHRTNKETAQKDEIPIRADHEGRSFYVDVIAATNEKEAVRLASKIFDKHIFKSAKRVAAQKASQVEKSNLPEVLEIALLRKDVVRCELYHAFVNKSNDPLNCRRNLDGYNKGMSRKKAHSKFNHFGHDPDCEICKQVLGTAKYFISRDYEMHMHTDRINFRFTLDHTQWSDTSKHGTKHTACLRDLGGEQGMICTIHL